MSLDAKNRLRVTEYLDLDLDREQWLCNRCGHVIGPARENYKRGCLLYDRDPREIHPPLVPGRLAFLLIRSGCASWNFIVLVVGLKWRPSICLLVIRSRMTLKSIWTV